MRRLLRNVGLGTLAALLSGGPYARAEITVPAVHDERLQLELFAAEPEIVTPIGLAIDARNRLFVLESHTHLAPRDYSGPKFDRVKIFKEARGDGRADRITVFADQINEGMMLGFSPRGELYVVCAREVIALHDRDDDDVSEARTTVLRLETQERYAHNSLLGITFSQDGWMYVSRGNTGGNPYVLKGSDDTSVGGYGDGGNIIRCRPDGSQVELVATGFWNAFDLKFDYAGRLLAVDNDPDARGPNRLLHIVPQGDYGYRSLYGGSGLHPFQAWDGDLPGTLPMMAGTGEAPSGLLDCSRAALPPEYRHDLLVTVWGEHNVTRFRTRPAGVSLLATNETLIAGGQTFRPVAIEAAPDGAIYITDWVEKDYPNHGKGRIWKLSARSGTKVVPPRAPFSPPVPDEKFAPFARLQNAGVRAQYSELKLALSNPDPFLRHAAVSALARPIFREHILADLHSASPQVRLGCLLALRQAGHAEPVPLLRKLLREAEAEVRRMALIWTAEQSLTELSEALEHAIATDVSPVLFETYLAARQELLPETIAAYRKQTRGNQIQRRFDPAWIEGLISDSRRPATVRALALARLSTLLKPAHFPALASLLQGGDPLLRIEAVRTLAHSPESRAVQLLANLAREAGNPAELRAEAILALAQHPEKLNALLSLLDDVEPAVPIELARALRSWTSNPDVSETLMAKYRELRKSSGNAALLEQIELALAPGGAGLPDAVTPQFPRPATHDEWRRSLAEPPVGNRDAGRRVFFSALTACSQCHRVGGRGGSIGPDLSLIARTASRSQLIQSILAPSDDVSPQFQGWRVETTDDESHTGLQLHHKARGALDLITLDGKTVRFTAAQIASYAAMQISIMPEGLENTMTVPDFRDLLSYLESLK